MRHPGGLVQNLNRQNPGKGAGQEGVLAGVLAKVLARAL